MNRKKMVIIVLIMIFISYKISINTIRSPKNNPITVVVDKAKFRVIRPEVSVIGNVIAQQGVDVSSKISGIVSSIYFQSGQQVQKGDILLELQNADLKAAYRQSLSKLNLARHDYARYTKLIKNGTISSSDFDKFSSQLNEAEADVSYRAALLDQTIIRAPFNGKVGICKINLGQYISPGQIIVNLQALSALYVDFSISEQYIHQISENAKVTIINNSNEAQIIRGHVVAFGSSVDLETRTLPVRAIIENPTLTKIIPGMAVEVNLTLSSEKISLLVPQSAIAYGPLGEYVYKVKGQHVQQTKIVTGESYGSNIEILSGLNKDDVVVCSGQIKLHPGVLIAAISGYH